MNDGKKIYSNSDLRKLIIPIAIEQLLVVFVGFLSTIMVSSVGEDAVSAVSLVDSINQLFNNVFIALGTGGTVVISQFIGKKKLNEAQYSAKQLMLIMSLITAVFTIVCLTFSGVVLQLLFGSVTAGIMANARICFFYTAMSYPFVALYYAGTALFRAIDRSRTTMYIAFIMNGLNIALNILLIRVFDLGVLGVAISTVIAKAVACIIVLCLLARKDNLIYIDSYFDTKFEWTYIKKILTIAIPSGIENGIFQFGKIILQRLVTTIGTYAITAYAITSNINQLIVVTGYASGVGLITIVGRCIGAEEYEQAKHYIKKVLKWAYITVIIISTGVQLGLPWILQRYSLSMETTELARICITINFIGTILIWPSSFALPNALRAANDARFTMVISIFSMVVFRCLLGYVFALWLNLGVAGIWLAMMIDWLFRSIMFVSRYLSNKWQEKKLV